VKPHEGATVTTTNKASRLYISYIAPKAESAPAGGGTAGVCQVVLLFVVVIVARVEPNVEGVNVVRRDGRYKLPSGLADRFEGQHLAAWENSRGNIELKPVRPDDNGGETA